MYITWRSHADLTLRPGSKINDLDGAHQSCSRQQTDVYATNMVQALTTTENNVPRASLGCALPPHVLTVHDT